MAIAWWLVPTEADAKPLEAAIKEAGTRHHAPTFPPHVTLFSLASTSKTTEVLVQTTKTVLSTSASTTAGVLTLEQSEVQVGETFHQSVFVALKPTTSLTNLRSALLKAVGAPAKTESPHFPHASLYYGDGSTEDKHHVVAHLMDARAVDISHEGVVEVSHLPPEGISFDGIWIVNIGGKNPSDWKVLHKEPLSGSKDGEVASATVAARTRANGTAGAGSRLSMLAENEVATPTTAPAPTPAPAPAPAAAPATNGKDIKEVESPISPTKSEPSTDPSGKAAGKPKKRFSVRVKKLLHI